MKQRFQNILAQRKKSKGILTVSAILLTIAISGSLVGCSNNQSDLTPPSKQANAISTSSTKDQSTSVAPEQNDTSGSTPSTDSTYKTESDFLNSPEGVNFQKVGYKSAKAYLSGDLKQVAQYFLDPKNASLKTEDIFDNLEYMILKWSLRDIKSENEISASYEYKINGEDSVSYITMELQKVNSDWKIKFIGVEK